MKRSISILLAMTLILALFTISASAEGVTFRSAVKNANVTVIQPIGGNSPVTSVDGATCELFLADGNLFEQEKYQIKSVSYLSWSDSDSVNFGEFVTGQEYLVTVEIAAVNFESFDHYFNEALAPENCKINGVTATAVSLKENNKVMVVHANLKAVALDSILDFGQVAPGMSAADEARHQTDLGDIEYGIYTMFGYDIYPLSQAQKDMGYTVEEKIYVNYGGGTLVTRSSGNPFDIMMYVDQLLTRGSNPFSDKWSVWFTVNLSQNDEYVGSIGHIYNFNIVPALVSSVQLNAPKPIVNTAPDNDLGNYSVGGEGYEIVDVDWTDTEGIIMPDQAVFEADKIYECVLQVEPMAGYVFPENKADFSGKINGIEGVVSSNYSSTRAYVTVQFSFSADIAYGDVNGDESINAKDALEVLKAAVNKITLNEEQKLSADVNEDQAINAKDALEILKYAVSKPSALDKFYKE